MRGGATTLSSSKKFFAFSLAEVLITLGIIGIVAAMTLPALIQKHQKQEATARLKKFITTMEQAVLFAEAENGTKAYQWSGRSRDYQDELNDNPQLVHDKTYAYWNKYFAPYVKALKVEKGQYIPQEEDEDVSKSTSTKVYLTDGSTLDMHFGNCIDLKFDINGDRLPNESGKDQFLFFMPTTYTYYNEDASEIARNKSFAPAYMPILNTRDKAMDYCKNRGPQFCAALLQHDNWEFKDDYPRW